MLFTPPGGRKYFLISSVLAVEMSIFGSQIDSLCDYLIYKELIIPERDFT